MKNPKAETEGIATASNDNQAKEQANNKTILSPETSVLIQPRLRALTPRLQPF